MFSRYPKLIIGIAIIIDEFRLHRRRNHVKDVPELKILSLHLILKIQIHTPILYNTDRMENVWCA